MHFIVYCILFDKSLNLFRSVLLSIMTRFAQRTETTLFLLVLPLTKPIEEGRNIGRRTFEKRTYNYHANNQKLDGANTFRITREISKLKHTIKIDRQTNNSICLSIRDWNANVLIRRFVGTTSKCARLVMGIRNIYCRNLSFV